MKPFISCFYALLIGAAALPARAALVAPAAAPPAVTASLGAASIDDLVGTPPAVAVECCKIAISDLLHASGGSVAALEAALTASFARHGTFPDSRDVQSGDGVDGDSFAAMSDTVVLLIVAVAGAALMRTRAGTR